MQMEKRGEVAFIVYFILLFLLVGTSIKVDVNIVNLVYLIVVLCSLLKFILIVSDCKK